MTWGKALIKPSSDQFAMENCCVHTFCGWLANALLFQEKSWETGLLRLKGTSQALQTKLCSNKWKLPSQLRLHRALCTCILCITKDNFYLHEQCSSLCFYPQKLNRIPVQVPCFFPESLAATSKTTRNWTLLIICGLWSCPQRICYLSE